MPGPIASSIYKFTKQGINYTINHVVGGWAAAYPRASSWLVLDSWLQLNVKLIPAQTTSLVDQATFLCVKIGEREKVGYNIISKMLQN